MFRLFLLALIAASPVTTNGSDGNAIEIADEMERILTLSQPDADRNEAVPFSDVTVECLPYDEQLSFARVVEPFVIELKRTAAQRRFSMNAIELASARADLHRLKFYIDEGIAKRDAELIAESMAANPFVDPRVLRFEYRDADTVVVTTGVVQGPLSGGGSIYIARRENGSWMVRHSSHWVS
ncbi:hypothetical protein RISK_003198 [Rhodopirellula islandica]|uniref:Signal peptide and transmembrane protein n=1 Tax=Rhodopirellula islandica TaxID=595434 RepID=A0A0J1BEH8_RHOIS|nr:hypothetical protein [Rhodopirellula islandica]KLU04930.1 hypothetical protein RISK_003198 [Rhodopirellula islandica]